MSIFKRFRSTVTAHMDDLVSQIENHDAVIASALTEAKVKVAKTKVRRSALVRESQSLQEKLQQSIQEVERWGERAVASQGDQEKALACMQRRKLCQQRVAELEQLIKQVTDAVHRMQHDIERAERNIHQMKQKREVMMARETAADSMQVLSTLDTLQSGSDSGDLNKTFHRWEERISIQELSSGADYDAPLDELAQSFTSDETRAELLQELDQLVSAADTDTAKNNTAETDV